ncbi:MAG: acyl carrier protein [Lachnospiraceae bacterium]|nr:acyl carrier protein [Lachnospiraceae bacterium]
MNEIEEKIQEIFREVFEDEELVIAPGITADDIEGWDSLTHFQMIMEVEMEFGIKFTTEEIASLATVGELLSLIESKGR